ncbi:DUF4429 domain-containing protein [Streptomyces sp. NPDC021224]|uniref:DUF4429 domain-containing protein n=1 Tax=unclassified Streptomyces TaxID=2593676 RepID=UPI0037AFCAA9
MLSAKGTNGTIHFDGQTVTIERTGFSARVLVGGGEKRIPVASITAVQWRKASLATGFIQFTLAGGVERRSKPGQTGSDAKRDENTVTFGARQQPAFEPIRQAIDDAIAARHAPQQAAASFGGSVADELGKLAALRQQGIISDADFEQAKARLIGG